MRGLIAKLVLAALGAALFAATHAPARSAVGLSIDELDGRVPTLYVPPARVLRLASLGQWPTVADLLFLRLVQYIGTDAASDAGWPQLYDLGNSVTDADPRFGYAYEVTGLVLIGAKRPLESTRIFEKGMAALPNRWQLPFFNAFNYWYELEDPARGAEMLFAAARVPKAPEHISEFATRLMDHAGRLDTALAYVETMLAGTTDPTVRERMILRRAQIFAEMDLRRLDAAIDAFEAQEGRLPVALAELVEFGLLAELPTSPDGVPYQWDPITRSVSWWKLERRIKYKDQGQL